MSRQTRIATYVGIALTGFGFLLIALAWNGAASFDYTPAQFPYLISGGLTGIGLIVVGVTVMIVQTMRQDGADRGAEMERLAEQIRELQVLLSPPDEYDPTMTGEYRPRPRARTPAPSDAPTGPMPVATGPGSSQQPS